MNTRIFAFAAVLALSGAAWAHEGHDHGAKGAKEEAAEAKEAKSASYEGDIVDMFCYAGSAMPEKHAACAKKCVKDGAPMGFVTKNDDVFLILNDHEHDKAYEAAKGMAGEHVTLTGKAVTRGKLPALLIEDVKKGDKKS